MSLRVPASQLYEISAGDINEAIDRLRAGESPDRFADSSKFDLLIQADRLPPKAVVALAAERTSGRVLTPDEFSGGESSAAFRLLLDRGFQIVTKQISMESFDATFSLGQTDGGTFLLFESKGPDRNIDYLDGLSALLDGLAEADAVICSIRVESSQTRNLSDRERVLRMERFAYPITLQGVGDVTTVRRAITRAAAQVGREADARGGGNPTKRLRVDLSFSEELLLSALAQQLTGRAPIEGQVSRPFEFIAQAPTGRGGQTGRTGHAGGTVKLLHDEMQQTLYEDLVSEHGRDCVAAELRTAGGRPADLVVNLGDVVDVYEIKTSRAPRDCIREAVGQLLEYGYWPGSPSVRSLFVVGPTPLDADAENYLEALRRAFELPLRYRDIAGRGSAAAERRNEPA